MLCLAIVCRKTPKQLKKLRPTGRLLIPGHTKLVCGINSRNSSSLNDPLMTIIIIIIITRMGGNIKISETYVFKKKKKGYRVISGTMQR